MPSPCFIIRRLYITMRLKGTFLFMGVYVMKLNYSVDMIRLRVNLPVELVEEYIKIFSVEPSCIYYQRRELSAHKHNFKFRVYNSLGVECGFWLGIQHNSLKVGKSVDVVFEYNPNKCFGNSVLEYILNTFYKDNSRVEVKKMDIAIDMPVNILKIKFNKDRRDLTIQDKGSDNKTFYIGSRSSEGHIKIYNKKRESNLDYELTRYEITIEPKMRIDSMIATYKFNDKLLLPVSCIDDLQFDFDMKGQDIFNILAVLDNPMLLGLLDKRKAKKIKDRISSINPVTFDTANIKRVIVDFLRTIYTV